MSQVIFHLLVLDPNQVWADLTSLRLLLAVALKPTLSSTSLHLLRPVLGAFAHFFQDWRSESEQPVHTTVKGIRPQKGGYVAFP